MTIINRITSLPSTRTNGLKWACIFGLGVHKLTSERRIHFYKFWFLFQIRIVECPQQHRHWHQTCDNFRRRIRDGELSKASKLFSDQLQFQQRKMGLARRTPDPVPHQERNPVHRHPGDDCDADPARHSSSSRVCSVGDFEQQRCKVKRRVVTAQ